MKPFLKPFFYLILFFFAIEANSQNCSEGSASSVKHHKIYLYFPSADDPTFSDYGFASIGVHTSPLKKFDVADLDPAIGSTDDLIGQVLNIVAADYCEFDVQVVTTKTKPAPTEAQWNVVGIGTDNQTASGLFGVAMAVDVNNTNPQDFARVWAGTYKGLFGTGGTTPPLVLSGAGSTLDGWSNAVGGTSAHEAGHNYGLAHSTTVHPGEDSYENHLMPAGSFVDGAHRVKKRHFSDEDYEILGHNIGLNTFTLTNWDFINPNAQEAHSCVLTILSHAASLSFSRVYNGPLCPWANPTITSSGTATFQGDTYNQFLLTFSVPKTWGGGTSGIVAGGAQFHVGASFNEPDLFIVSGVVIKDAGGTALGLHPRVPSFDAGSSDMASGDFMMKMINGDAAKGALRIENVQVFYLPRMASIQNMISGDSLRDNQGFILHMNNASKNFSFVRNTELKDSSIFRLAKYTDPRTVDIKYDSTGCKIGLVPVKRVGADGMFNNVEYCPTGNALSLFPATYVYMIVTMVDPNATYFDKAQNKMVTGPLTSKVFYQFAGKVPDFNNNGIDDLLDIRKDSSIDKNHNGIPDSAEAGNPNITPMHSGSSFWILALIIFIFVACLIYFFSRKKK